MTDRELSSAIDRNVWRPASAIPGRHRDALGNSPLLDRVEVIVREVDSIQPDGSSTDLLSWADREVRRVGAVYDLDEQAIAALRALLSWQWR